MGAPNQNQSFLSLKDWLLSLVVPVLAGVVGSQSLAIERISLRQNVVIETLSQHNREDRERDGVIAQLRVELAKLSVQEDSDRVQIEKCSVGKK